MVKGRYYRTCLRCSDHLDPDERNALLETISQEPDIDGIKKPALVHQPPTPEEK